MGLHNHNRAQQANPRHTRVPGGALTVGRSGGSGVIRSGGIGQSNWPQFERDSLLDLTLPIFDQG
jgi:hypothetical protein